MSARGREYTLLGVAIVLACAVAVLGLHRAGLYALPGDRITVWFPATTETAEALERIGSAGAVLDRAGPVAGMYRVYVLDAAAPRKLAGSAWVLREPIDGLAQCFGIDTGGPNRG